MPLNESGRPPLDSADASITEMVNLSASLAGGRLSDHPEFVRAITSSMGEGLYALDREARVTFVNPAAERLLGWTEAELLGRRMHEAIHFQDSGGNPLPENECRLLSALRTGETVNVSEDYFTRRDRSLFPVSYTSSPILRKGRVAGAVFTFRDITEQKRAEDEIRRQKEILQKIFDHIPLMISFFGQDGRPCLVNREWEQTRGWTLAEMKEHGPDILAESYPDVAEYLRTLDFIRASTGDWNDFKTRMRDGRVLDVSWAAIKLSDGTRITIGQDITERKGAEERLRRSERQLAEAQRLAHIGSWDWDLQNNTLIWSDEHYRIFGLDPQEYNPGFESAVMEFVHPEDRDLVKSTVEHSIATEEPFNFNYRVIHPDGGVRVVHSRGNVVTDEQGNVIRMFGTAQDVTEVKRAEEQIEFQARALSHVSEAVIAVDNARRVTYWNGGAERLYGYKSAEVLGRSLEEVNSYRWLCPEDEEAAQSSLAATGYWHGENIHQKKGGEEIHVESSVSVLKDEGDEGIGLLAVIRDITGRKRGENALRRTNRALAVLSSCNQAVAHAAGEAGLLREICEAIVAEGGYRMAWIGYPQEDEGRSVKVAAQAGFEQGYLESIGITWADVERGRGPAGTALREGRVCVVGDMATDPSFALWKDIALTRGFASVAALPLLMGGRVSGVLCIYAAEVGVFDGEELKLLRQLADDLAFGIGALRADAERERAEEKLVRLATAVEQSAESIVITDEEGLIQYVNPAFEQTTGYTKEEAIGEQPEVLMRGENEAAFYKELLDTVKSGEVWTGCFKNKRKDGTSYEEEGTISPVRDASGRVINFVAVKRDVTQQRHLEQQLRQAQKMEAVGRLAGGVAHDFNNILTAITGYSDLAARKLEPTDPLRRNIEEVKKAADRASNLTRQLLAFSRKQVLQPRVVDLNQLVEDSIKMLRRLIGEDIEVCAHFAPRPDQVLADPGQIEQVLMNLVVNARDAMPAGGQITVKTANVLLSEEFVAANVGTRPGHFVMLSVSDTGCGMDEKTKSQIFEPFFTTKGVDRGTGLGLSTVYGIVKQSGGYIYVDSEVGKGTTFRIYLPSIKDEAEVEGPAGEGAELAEGWETILLVEDDATLRRLAREILETYGYHVMAAADGREALRMREEYGSEIHLLLTDVVMPGMSGRELAERVRERWPGTRSLFISGYTDDAIIHHGIQRESIAFLQKPFTPDALSKTVRKVLDSPDQL